MDMSNTTNTTAKRLHLQGIGSCPAITAAEVVAGDIVSWNYSPEAYEVVSIDRVSPQFFSMVEMNRKTGKTYTRRIKADRLVVVSR